MTIILAMIMILPSWPVWLKTGWNHHGSFWGRGRWVIPGIRPQKLLWVDGGLRHLNFGVEYFWVVVSNICYFHPYLGKSSNLADIFQMGWNHELDFVDFKFYVKVVLVVISSQLSGWRVCSFQNQYHPCFRFHKTLYFLAVCKLCKGWRKPEVNREFPPHFLGQ